MLNIMIIADDLTGAADTGVKFIGCGPVKLINANFDQSGELGDLYSGSLKINLAVTTETRNSPAEKLPDALARAAALSGKRPPELIYKKIDSCLRGHIGAELKHLLNNLAYQAALVAPAYPAFNRVTKGGIHYINGTPVSKTELAKDPIRPVCNSSLAEILAQEHDWPVHRLDLDLIRRGAKTLLAQIDFLCQRGQPPCLLAADAETGSDLNIIAEVGLMAKNRLILAGSAGLAEALAGQLNASAPPPVKIKHHPGPVVFFGGSASEALRAQLAYMAGHCRVEILTLNPALVMAGKEPVIPSLAGGQALIVNLPRPQDSPGYDSLELIRAFGRQGAAIIKRLKAGAIFLSGGDTAREVLKALNIGQLWIEAEIRAGVVSLSNENMAVVTKSGTFGDISLLKEVYELLTNKRSDCC